MSIRPTVRYAIRSLLNTPSFTAVAVLSLALGIGANVAIFTLVNALLLRELPVREPKRLVQLSVVRRSEKIPFSYPMFEEIQRGQRVFSGLFGWTLTSLLTVEINGVLSQASVDSVTGNYYSELGAIPLLGRLIASDDTTQGGAVAPVAVLGYEFWQRRFGGASDVLGKQIRIQGQPFTIIGVTRRWFTGMTTGRAPEVTTPIKGSDNRSQLWVSITGRWRDGVSVKQARAQLQSLWPAVLAATASTQTQGLRRNLFFSMGLDVAPVATGVARDLRAQFTQPLYVLLGIVGLILLVACVNLANLMLARAAARSHELSVRVALGAGRSALAGQALAESLVLSFSGALLGLALAYGGSRLLVALMTDGYLTPVTLDLRPDWRVLAMTTAVVIVTALLFGAAPAWRSSREDPASVLQRNRRSTGSMGRSGKVLMVTQVALSFVLLLGAGLLARSFQRLCTVDPGFEPRVLEVSLCPRPGGYENLDVAQYRRQLVDRVASAPGVVSAAFSSFSGPGQRVWQDAVSMATAASEPSAGVISTALMISPGFLGTMGIGLVGGRDFDWTDDQRHPAVAILSSGLADRLFPSGNALGQRVRFSFLPEFQNIEIVGLVRTARLFDLRNAAEPVIYMPYLQHPDWSVRGDLFLRARSDSGTVAAAVGREIESFGHEYLLRAKAVEEAVSHTLAADRAVALLSGFFAVLALGLACIGLYGLTSYGVMRRTREIGIRSALGARPGEVRWGILREASTLTLAGMAVGIPCGLGGSRLIAAVLFGISPGDVPTVIAVSLLLLTVALVASYVPALRASRIDPTIALRSE